MDMLELTSHQNPRIKRLLRLRKRSDRDGEQVFVIEGYRELRRALDCGWLVEELYLCPELYLGENEQELIDAAVATGAQCFRCSAPVFQKVAYRDRPDGLLAVAPQAHLGLEDIPEMDNPFLLLMVGIEKPGNLGTMLRSADAAGVDAVLLCDPVTDIYNPNTVRASVGTLFSVPIIECSRKDCLAWLREQGIPLLAATPHTDKDLYDLSLSGPVAVAVGSEMHGLDDAWMDAADLKVRLPMMGIADSLNVSSAAAIVLYETLRQRRAASL